MFDLSFHPSISALFVAKKSLRNFSGFSGSFVAKCFIASNRYGVTCWFKYTRVGLPCGIGCVGACCDALGCGELRDEAGATGAGVGVAAETGVGVGAGCDSGRDAVWGCCCSRISDRNMRKVCSRTSGLIAISVGSDIVTSAVSVVTVPSVVGVGSASITCGAVSGVGSVMVSKIDEVVD